MQMEKQREKEEEEIKNENKQPVNNKRRASAVHLWREWETYAQAPHIHTHIYMCKHPSTIANSTLHVCTMNDENEVLNWSLSVKRDRVYSVYGFACKCIGLLNVVSK